jgi:hypothetical protein
LIFIVNHKQYSVFDYYYLNSVYSPQRRPPKYIRYSNRPSLAGEAYFGDSVCAIVGGNWSNSALYRFSVVGEKDPGIPFLEVLGIGMIAGAVTGIVIA